MVRNLITLYPSNETSFTSNGLGSLADSESCIVKEEYNGAFELEMTYPITGAHYKDIEPRCIIYTKPNPIDPPQAFRIYQITKPMNGMISIYANHISYDLDGYPLEPFSSENCAGALQGFVTHSVIKNPFTFWTDKETLANFAVKTPMSIRSALGGTEGSILDVYGGVYKFDNFTVRLFQHRGSDRGVTIRYGKNLTDLNQEEEIANCYTEVMPYWYDQENDILLKLSENTVPVENQEFNFRRVLVLDVSSDFEEQPSEAQMRERAKQYIQDNQIWVPKVSLTVSYAQLSQSEEYKQYNMYERVEIDDTVNIEFQKLGITAHAKVIETDYNVKYGRYDSVTLGNAQSSMSSTFADQAEEFKQRVEQTKSDLQRSVDRATKWITNGRGYMVAVKDPEGNWMEICSLDTPNLDEAMNVWRWNNAGFGFSANGYNGEYRTAITQDGHIVADFIDTGTLTATLVKTGILQSKDGETFYLDLDRGILRMKATGLSIEGKTVEEIAQEKAEAAKAYADQQIANYSNLVTNEFANVQSQLDGQIESYFRQYEPKMTNEPASEWDTDEKRQAHEGDIFYWEKEDGTSYAYRFMKDSTLGSWGWNLLQDTDITKAIADAAHAQDTADGKRRNFVITPYPPYDIGDQWTDSDTGEVYTCVTAKAKGGIYNREDWSKLNIYTDDTIANQALDEARKSKYLVMSLDNDYEGILTDPSGHYEGTLNAQTKVQVFWGTKDVSGDCEYVIIPSSGVKANWNLAIRTVTVTELTTDKGYVDITAKYNDDTFEVTKRFNVAKVKRGLDGATGKDGEDGADGTSYKIKVTSMHLSQTQLDQIASPEESHWPETFTLDTGVSENTTADLKVGDYVSLSVYNEDKDSIAYVQGKVVGISSVSVLTCNTYGYIDRGDAGKKTVQLKCGKLSHTLAEWESYGTDGKESTWTISGYDNSSIAVGDNVYLVGSASDALDSTGNPINVILYMTAKSISASSFVGIATALVMGYEGKQGEKGEQGEPGKQGAKGDKGEQGTQGINLIRNSSGEWSDWITPTPNMNNQSIMPVSAFLPSVKNIDDVYTCSVEIEFKDVTSGTGAFSFRAQGTVDGVWTIPSIWNYQFLNHVNPPTDGVHKYVYGSKIIKENANATNFGIGFRADYWGSGSYRYRNMKVEEGTVTNPIWTPAPQDLIGPQGPAGPQGVQGPKGTDGKTYYTWLKYATSPTTGMSDSPDGKSYIGLAYNKDSATESSNYSDYQWSLIKGEKGDQGVPGGKGADGKTLYTWIKYADDAKGTGISDSPTGKPYIGLAYNKDTSAESSDPSAYTWSLIQGEQGTQGINLLENSSFNYGNSKWSTSVIYTIESNAYNGNNAIHITAATPETGRSSVVNELPKNIFKLDTDYTFSFMFYMIKKPVSTTWETDAHVRVYIDGSVRDVAVFLFTTSSINLNTWTKVVLHFRLPSANYSGYTYPELALGFGDSCDLKVSSIKLEEGNVPNPIWTPAPQDLVGPQGSQGINLLTGTKNFEGNWNYLNYWTRSPSDDYLGLSVYKRSETVFGMYQVYTDTVTGETYTFSFYAKCDGVTSRVINVHTAGDNIPGTNPEQTDITITNQWARYVVHFNIITGGKKVNCRCDIPTVISNSSVYLCGLKLEKGTVDNPTWTPAPQDLVGPTDKIIVNSNTIRITRENGKYVYEPSMIVATAYSKEYGSTGLKEIDVYWAIDKTSWGGSGVTGETKGPFSKITVASGYYDNILIQAYYDSARKELLDEVCIQGLKDPEALSAEETFNLLTDNGKRQGLFQDEDGNYYISFTYAKGGTLVLGSTNNARGELQVLDTDGKTVVGRWNNAGITISKGLIRSANYKLDDQGWPSTGIAIEVDNGNFHTRGISAFDSGNVYILKSLTTQSGGRIAGFIFTTNRFYKMMEASTSNYGVGMSTSPSYYGLWLGETNTAGGNGLTDAPFKVLLSGSMYATNAHISGSITGSNITGSTFYTNSMPANIAMFGKYIYFRYITQSTDIEEIDPDWGPTENRETEAWIYTGYGSFRDWSEFSGGTVTIGNTIILTDKCFTIASHDDMAPKFSVVQDHVTHNIGTDYVWAQRLMVTGYITCGSDVRTMGTVYAANFVNDGGDVILPVSTASYGSISGYSYATTTPYYGDIGEGDLDEEGFCYIYIDDAFSEMINTNQYMVFLQKEGPGDLWIKEKTKTYFVVEGTPLLHFSWELKAKKKSNEYLRLENMLNFNEAPKSELEHDITSAYEGEQNSLQDARIYNEDMKTDSDEAAKTLKELETNYDIEVNNLIKEREELL